MHSVHRFSASLLVGSALTALPLSAAMAATSENTADPATEMEPIVVTATVGPRTVGESLSSVTVLDEEAIERQQPKEFKDLLRGQPGINVISNGSFGKNTSVYTRGAGSESTVFLIDGIRLRSSTNGSAPWQHFPVELVERIELVRGPRSSLYGADAVGGVVQAFTHDPKVEDHRGWVEARGGSFGTRKGAGGVAVRAGRTRLSFSGVHAETDGTAIVEDGEDRGYRNSAGVARVSHELDNGGEAGLVLMQSQGNTEYENGNTDYTVRVAGFRLAAPVSDYWDTAFQVSEARDEQESFESSGNSVFNTVAHTARWENTLAFGTHELALGTELLDEEVESTADFEETSRTNVAAFSQLRLGFGPTDVQLSLRVDDNEAYGQNETGAVALGYSFDRSHRVRASYGTAFRAPTFNDLYYPGANPDLRPEESDHVELGVSGNYQNWYWDAAVFQLNIDDMIAWRPMDSGLWQPVNVDQARIRGLELSSGVEIDHWHASAALTFLDPRNRSDDNRLVRRSAKQFRFDLDRTFRRWSLGASLNAEGYRYNDDNNDQRLPGFATLDLRAGWDFAEDWSTQLSVDNVFDKEYATARTSGGEDYIAAGRTAMLTLRYDIQ